MQFCALSATRNIHMPLVEVEIERDCSVSSTPGATLGITRGGSRTVHELIRR